MSRFEGHFLSIDEPECLTLLEAQQIGRVGWSSNDGQLVLPVNYRVDRGRVVFHTSPTSPLAALVDPTPVAFQADNIDQDSGDGWSVLVVGVSGPAGDAPDTHPWAPGDRRVGVSGPAGDAPDTHPWAPGDRRVGVAITVDRVSGRVVISPDSSEPSQD